MPQKDFTAEEVAAIKAKSAESFNGRTLRIDIDDPINTTIVVAPHDRASYIRHRDRVARDVPTAQHAVLLDRLLWPSPYDVEMLRREWAALPEKVSTALNAEAGRVELLATVRPLEETIRAIAAERAAQGEGAATWAPPGGLTEVDAQAMIDAEKARAAPLRIKPARLWTVELLALDLSVVMATPPTETWLAAKTLQEDASRTGKGTHEAAEAYILDAVKWSREPIQDLLNRRPALLDELRICYLRMGGDGAAVRTKSL